MFPLSHASCSSARPLFYNLLYNLVTTGILTDLLKEIFPKTLSSAEAMKALTSAEHQLISNGGYVR